MASLLLGDLNDYIQPSVACIKPGETGKSVPPQEEAQAGGAENKGKPVVVNLNDCLACSGCVTSAETVLVAEQSHQQIYKVLEENKQRPDLDRRIVVVSICPSTRAALSRRYALSLEQVHLRLCYFFKTVLGADAVLDTSFAQNLALSETAAQFVERYRRGRGRSHGHLPMLTSECPGWICYAEKRQPAMLPLISTVRSPQQLTGMLVKGYLAQGRLRPERDVRRGDIFHVAVMSCYDKKLEASRTQFADDADVRDVDCVIVTTELLAMVGESTGDAFPALPEAVPREDEPLRSWVRCAATGGIRLLGHGGSSAGGYLSYVMQRAAKELFGLDATVGGGSVEIRTLRNADYTEYTLVGAAGPLLRFAAVYGFRNIQTFVQKAKHGRVDYDFVEVMACPGACLFGGGQPKPDDTSQRAHGEHRSEMERIYAGHLTCDDGRGEDAGPLWPSEIKQVLGWIREDPEARRAEMHTFYRALEDSSRKNPLINVQW